MSSEILIQFKIKFLQKIEEKIAECPSSYPDSSAYKGQMHRRIYDSKQALIWIFLSTFRPYWETDKIINQIGQRAYLSNYQGNWTQVQEYLETYEPKYEWFIEKFLQNHSPEDFFGNFLRQVNRELRLIQFKREPSAITDKRKVHKAQRARGYKDKGTLRLPSDFHGERPYVEREDRRKKVNHPLLKENIKAGELKMGLISSSRKEEYFI